MLQNIGLLTRFGSIEVFKRTKAHLIFMKEQIWRPTKHDIACLEMFRGFLSYLDRSDPQHRPRVERFVGAESQRYGLSLIDFDELFSD